jgi:hypothetical protein
LALNASKQVVSVANTGTGDNVLATSPTLVAPNLGTPASGVVTNLTGTASININGTVGATTASTGAFTTLSATGVTTVQAGTAAAPAITTSGDTNTGIFFPAADTIAFSEGGSERMRITALGNVGIGTTSPGARLDLWTFSSPGGGNTLRFTNATPSIANGGIIGKIEFYSGDASAPGPSVKAFIASVSEGTSPDGALVFATDTNTGTPTERMRITSAGNVGIGTSSPGEKLVVSGGGLQVTGALSTLNRPSSSVVDFFSGRARYFSIGADSATSGSFSFSTSTTTTATERMRITDAGNVGIGTSSPAYRLTASVPDNNGVLISSGNDSHTGFLYFGDTSSNTVGAVSYDHSNNSLRLQTAGSERMRITSAGNLGLGTTSPSASAILDAQSTTKGVRMPNMTTTQKNAIASPAAGLMVYDTTLAKLCVYTTAWETITSI